MNRADEEENEIGSSQGNANGNDNNNNNVRQNGDGMSNEQDDNNNNSNDGFYKARKKQLINYMSEFQKVSLLEVAPTPIEMRDNRFTNEDPNEVPWVKDVHIGSFSIVGGANKAGSYVVWNITIETLEGGKMTIRKRYSELDGFRQGLMHESPEKSAAIPLLPSKSAISKFRPEFLEERRKGLEYFLSCILLNPAFQHNHLVREFVCQ